MLVSALLLGAAATACREKAQQPLRSLTPAPLPSLSKTHDDGGIPKHDEGVALQSAETYAAWGERLPSNALVLSLQGTRVQLGGAKLDLEDKEQAQVLKDRMGRAPVVLLAPDAETYLAQVSALLAMLEESGVEVWLRHASEPVAFKLKLRDEEEFRRWLDEPKPGKIRIIQRSDGLELQTNVGKLPGADPNGPTLPLRGGRLDIANLRRGLARLLERFPQAKDSCLVPSFGVELSRIATVLSGYYRGPGEPMFSELCLVYPRPH
jgi:hypothetical protein